MLILKCCFYHTMQQENFPPIQSPMELLQFYRLVHPESKVGIKLRQTIDIFLTKSEQVIQEGNEELKSYYQKKFLEKEEK